VAETYATRAAAQETADWLNELAAGHGPARSSGSLRAAGARSASQSLSVSSGSAQGS